MIIIVPDGQTVIPFTGRKVAIVTLLIGDNYIELWQRLCSHIWQGYAEKCDFDLIAITGPLDTSERAQSRSPAWQKLLILNQAWSKQYERIIWLDSDIIISPRANNIMEHAGPPEKVSLCVLGGQISDAARAIYVEHLHKVRINPDYEKDMWTWEMHNLYEGHKVEKHDYMFNTGVMVLSPQHHNDLFLECYAGEHVARLYEQPKLSGELIKRNLFHVITNRFNWGIQEALIVYMPETIGMKDVPPALADALMRMTRFFVRRELANCYFLHFYGSMGVMQRLTHEDVFSRDYYETGLGDTPAKL